MKTETLNKIGAVLVLTSLVFFSFQVLATCATTQSAVYSIVSQSK